MGAYYCVGFASVLGAYLLDTAVIYCRLDNCTTLL